MADSIDSFESTICAPTMDIPKRTKDRLQTMQLDILAILPVFAQKMFTQFTQLGQKVLIAVLLVACGHTNNNNPALNPDTTAPSIARQWNELLLAAIRSDFARPTIHARNLFHVSAAMYDAWAAYADTGKPYLLGQVVSDYSCDFSMLPSSENIHAAREEAISYAAYRLISHRFRRTPAEALVRKRTDELMADLAFDIAVTTEDYTRNTPAALGNYIAGCYIAYGLQDGSNEANGYANTSYKPVNSAIEPEQPGNPQIVDRNRWQPILLTIAIDQSENPVNSEPEFLSPEWGQLNSFALNDSDRTSYERDNFQYQVYFDPGSPPTFDGPLSDEYKWNFALVSIWSSHLAPTNNVNIDISPASIGNNNIDDFPTNFEDFKDFFDLFSGGDNSMGREVNPVTGAPYEPQIVPAGDYARVLAEFWADGPDSETPPGHWFVILNEVSDQPLLEKRFGGIGPLLGPLEWDVKTYFTMGGAMHDSAIAAWSIKGWYDYIRPMSAIRAMAALGQSTSSDLPSYHVDGMPLYDGYIELVEKGDALAGVDDINVGKIKLLAWRGPSFIEDPKVDQAGVDWILGENWWPYQRPTFVTPPFAGYISGHSTFSRAAAEVMTALTGSEFFPGGMGEFKIKANEFLIFEEGPSTDLTLQWATYRDASDQCSLSRIWGGIHPPVDDLPGRVIGEQIGVNAFQAAGDRFHSRKKFPFGRGLVP